jgi:NADH:ubiquinone oxidoreductase subunit 6 (subunit J)
MVGGLAMATAGMLYLTQIDAGTTFVSHVLPAELLISVGMAGVFIPAASTALVGVGSHDAGVASALLNTTQQVGGSLGTALLNTLYASAVTAYLADNARSAADVQRLQGEALLSGYRVAYFWAGMMLVAALIAAIVLINARKDDVPREPALAAA